MVHSGFSAAGQLVTLAYKGKINDLTLWFRDITADVRYDRVGLLLAMSQRNVGRLAALAVPLLLHLSVVQSQCTTNYCDDDDSSDLLSLCRRNQADIARLQQEVTALKEEVAQKDDRMFFTHNGGTSYLPRKWHNFEMLE